MKKLILKRKKQFFIYVLACITPIVTDFLIMIFFALIFETLQKQNVRLFYYTIGLGLLVAISSALLYLMSRFLRIKYMRDTLLDVRLLAFDKIYSYSYQKFHKKSKDTYISNLTNDINVIENNFFISLINIIYNFGKYAISLLILLVYDYKFALVVLGISVMLFMLINFFKNKTTKLQENVSTENEKFVTRVSNNFNGLEIIKLNNLNESFMNKTMDNLRQLENRKIKYNIFNDFQGGLIDTISILVIICIILYQMQTFSENVSLGTIVLIFQLSNNMIFSLSGVLRFINQLKAAVSIFNKIAKKEDNDLSIFNEGLSFDFNKQIKVNNLSYHYDNKVILHNASFTIDKGKKYLIKGISGAGKTTLLNILAKMIENYEGSIDVDSVDLKDISFESFNSKVAYIYQDVFLFEDSVINNISLFNEVSKEKIDNALRLSGLNGEVALDLQLNENGKNLSGGQRQRISIARALVKDVEIVFVDECTSSLNEALGASIEQSLLDLDCTVIAVSHRFYEGITDQYDYVIEIKNGETIVIPAKNYFKEVIVC